MSCKSLGNKYNIGFIFRAVPNCRRCRRSNLGPKQRHRVVPGNWFWDRLVADVTDEIGADSWICRSCRRHYEHLQKPSTRKPFVEADGVIDVLKVGYTDSRCIACHSASNGRKKIPKKAVTQAFDLFNLIIPEKSKRCKDCIAGNQWTELAIEKLKLSRPAIVTPATFKASCKIAYSPDKSHGRLNFNPDNPLRTSDYCKVYLGLSALAFDDLFEKTKTFYTGRDENDKRRNLAMFLNKMRLGHSNAVIGADFGLHETTVGKMIDSVIRGLTVDYVPKYIGFSHISFENYKRDHSLTLSDRLFDVQDDEAIVIADATYLYCEKSNNQEFQKETFSVPKVNNLVKPTTLCAPDGYFLAVLNCFKTDHANNDAAILNSSLLDPRGIKKFAGNHKIKFIADRGYRDSRPNVEDLGWSIHMPSFRPAGLNQHTAHDSNVSRAVTSVRWTVEAAHGRVKKVFKIFRGTNTNINIDKINACWPICCAIVNDMFCVLKEDDPGPQNELATKMLSRMDLDNELQEFLDSKGSIKSVQKFEKEESSLPSFPRLTEKDVEEITFGVYQRKLAPSYVARKMKNDGFGYRQLKRSVACGRIIIRLEVKSKHQSSVKHKVFVQFDPTINGYKSLLGYYCTCLGGARTVGTCCHVASVIWYFGYGCHLDVLPFPAQNIGSTILDTRTVKYLDESEDDDDAPGADDNSDSETE